MQKIYQKNTIRTPSSINSIYNPLKMANTNAAYLKRRWTEQLEEAGAPANAMDSPHLAKNITVPGNPWSDCTEVDELNKACMSGTTGLNQESAICKAAHRYFKVCLERDEYCQDPTEH